MIKIDHDDSIPEMVVSDMIDEEGDPYLSELEIDDDSYLSSELIATLVQPQGES